MREVMAVTPWLYDIWLNNPTGRFRACTLMRAMIVIERDRGHILNVDRELVRRRIVAEIRTNRMPDVIVDCLRCREQAYLHDWVRSADYSPETIGAILADNHAHVSPLLYRFLLHCDECLRLAGTQIPDSTRGAGR